MKAALASYGRVLRQAARGGSTPIDLISHTGDWLVRFDASHWYADPRPGDGELLAACRHRTLDVGCGPGRLVTALIRRGVPALGIDISGEAVRQARAKGAPARLGDVFDPVPGEGGWGHVLLADGNIGIGGDPVRLLCRCRDLLAPGGSVVAELSPPGSGSWRQQVRLRHNGRLSAAFWWAAVAADDIDLIACAAGVRVARSWAAQGRWFATLVRSTSPAAMCRGSD